MTSEAPKEIWAFYAPEIEEDNPQCTIVAGDKVMHGAQKYIRGDHALAMVAAAYGDAAEAVADYPRTAPHRDEWIAYDEQIEHSQRCILTLTPADAIASLDARLKAERVKALREAINRITQDASDILDGIGGNEADIICAKLRHMIEKETDNE